MDIKKARVDLGVSQVALSIDTGISRYKISMHENNYFLLGKNDLDKIKKALLKRKGSYVRNNRVK